MKNIILTVCCVLAITTTTVEAKIPRDFDGHHAYGAGQKMDDPTVCKVIYFDHKNIPLMAGKTGLIKTVRASWYGNQFHTGQNTYVPSGGQMANGEYFHECDATVVAHKTLPKGTVIRVTNGNKSLMMVVQDRGPYVKGREIDLSRGAAQYLGIIGTNVGTKRVQIQILGRP